MIFKLILMTASPELFLKSVSFPHKVGQCALLAPVVSVRPQEIVELHLRLRCFGVFTIFGLSYTYTYSLLLFLPITPFGGPFWALRCQEIEGNMKNHGEKRQRNRRRQNAKT